MVLKVEKSGKNRRCAHLSTRRSQESVKKNPEESGVLTPGILFYPKERDFSPNPHCCPLCSSSSPPCHGIDFFFSVIFLYFLPESFRLPVPIILIFPHFSPISLTFFPSCSAPCTPPSSSSHQKPPNPPFCPQNLGPE